MPDLEQAAVTSTKQVNGAGRWFMRFTRAQRYMHAVLFTTFLGLAGTGLPLRFSESIWARGLAKSVGGFGAILFFHKLCAVVLSIAFLLHLKEVFTARNRQQGKGCLLGIELDGGQLERREGSFCASALVRGSRSAAALRSLRLLGKVRLLGGLLGHDRHWFFRLCDVVRPVLCASSCRAGRSTRCS